MKTEQKLKKKSNNYQEKKIYWELNFCLRHEIFTKSNVDKKSLTLFEATESFEVRKQISDMNTLD